MELEFNGKFENLLKVQEGYEASIYGHGIGYKTPPVGEDYYWVFRVKLSPKQAIIAFPKFNTFGVGFQKETEMGWNTNSPYYLDAEKIYNHIKENNRNIKKSDCIEAIRMIQAACKNFDSEGYHGN